MNLENLKTLDDLNRVIDSRISDILTASFHEYFIGFREAQTKYRLGNNELFALIRSKKIHSLKIGKHTFLLKRDIETLIYENFDE